MNVDHDDEDEDEDDATKRWPTAIKFEITLMEMSTVSPDHCFLAGAAASDAFTTRFLLKPPCLHSKTFHPLPTAFKTQGRLFTHVFAQLKARPREIRGFSLVVNDKTDESWLNCGVSRRPPLVKTTYVYGI